MEQYPTLKLIVDKGNVLAIVLGLLPVLGAVAVGFAFLWHWLILLAGVVLGVLLYGIARSYVELVRVVSDVLVPR